MWMAHADVSTAMNTIQIIGNAIEISLSFCEICEISLLTSLIKFAVWKLLWNLQMEFTCEMCLFHLGLLANGKRWCGALLDPWQLPRHFSQSIWGWKHKARMEWQQQQPFLSCNGIILSNIIIIVNRCSYLCFSINYNINSSHSRSCMYFN